MASENDEERPFEATLLEQIPPTSPALIKVMTDARFIEMHFAAVGRVASNWAYFEAVIDSWLCEFAGLNYKVAVCFTGQMLGPRPRIDAFFALARLLGAGKEWNKPFDDFAKDATGLAEQRNRAVHDVWRFDDPMQPRRIEATARKHVRLLRVHEPTEKLNALSQNILNLQRRFDDEIAGPIFTALRTSPGKPLP